MRGRGRVVIFRVSARDVERGRIPMVSEVAMRVERTRGGGKEGFVPAAIASSTISSLTHGLKWPLYLLPVRL